MHCWKEEKRPENSTKVQKRPEKKTREEGLKDGRHQLSFEGKMSTLTGPIRSLTKKND
jgi:hypothetical protein